jgi:hypothetical protein
MVTTREPDDLDVRERELSQLELKLDAQDSETRQVQAGLKRDKANALRALDHAAVAQINTNLERVQVTIDATKETRNALSAEYAQVAQERARRKAAADLEAYGPKPCLALSLPGRLGALGLDGHLVASIVPVVESHQHSVAWAEDPDRFMPGASPQELERVALALSKLISLIHGRDDEAEKALAQTREYCRDEAHRRRPSHPWRNHQGVGFP